MQPIVGIFASSRGGGVDADWVLVGGVDADWVLVGSCEFWWGWVLVTALVRLNGPHYPH